MGQHLYIPSCYHYRMQSILNMVPWWVLVHFWPSFEDCQAMQFTFLYLKCTLGESQCFFIGKFLSNFNFKRDFIEICPNSPDFL